MRPRRLLVEACYKLRLADLRKNGPRGKLRVRGFGIVHFEIITRGVVNPQRHVCLTFPDGYIQRIKIVERPMPHAVGGGCHPTRWEFDLGGSQPGTRYPTSLFLEPGGTIFRSRTAIGAKHASNAMRRRPLERFRREQCLARYPIDVSIGVRPRGLTNKEWTKIQGLFGTSEKGTR